MGFGSPNEVDDGQMLRGGFWVRISESPFFLLFFIFILTACTIFLVIASDWIKIKTL